MYAVEESTAPPQQHCSNSSSGGAAAVMCTRSLAPQGAKTEISVSPFRLVEKKYKLYKPDPGRHNPDNGKRRPPPEATDFTDVVDTREGAVNTASNAAQLHRHAVKLGRPEAGMADGTRVLPCDVDVPAYTFDGVPGLIIFPGVVGQALQLELCRQSLTEFALPPHPNNVSNLDANFDTNVKEGGYVPGMRWATLGYSYDWTKRDYKRDRFSPFPASLRSLIGQIVASVPQVDPSLAPVAEGYEAQTSIVNYYPVGSMMCAHQDLGEVCVMRPLVSLSLGCSAIFLMGTERRDDAPHAFMLRSGDVAVFTGPSRLAYHAVPRILDDTPDWLLAAAAAEEGEGGRLKRMIGLRVNINVRQVFDDAESVDAIPYTAS